jgi:hypothetical protein
LQNQSQQIGGLQENIDKHKIIMLHTIYPNFYVIFAMVVWLHSDIIYTIAKLSKLMAVNFVWRWLKIDEYQDHINNINVMASYPDFLYTEYSGYLTKLLSCPICLTFWFTMMHTVVLWNWKQAIVMFPINYCLTLTIYLVIRKLL